MEEILSNEEIEKLLQQFEGNNRTETTTKEEGPYDFTKPHGIKKENTDALKKIYGAYSKHIANYFTELIREPMKAKLISIDPVRQEEIVNRVPRNSILGSFTNKPLNGEFFIYLPDVFLTQMMEIICGLDIDEVSSKGKDLIFKELTFTDLEMSIIEDIMDNILQMMVPCWKEILPIEVKLNYVRAHKDSAQVTEVGKYSLITTISIEYFEIKGEVHICIPYEALESVADRLILKDQYVELPMDDRLKYSQEINDAIEFIRVAMEVRLGEVSMTVKDFLELEAGDIIQLNKHISIPLDMFVEDKLKYKVVSGKKNGNLAVKVVGINDEGDSE